MTFIHQKTMTNEIILESPPEIKTNHIQPSECAQKVEMGTYCYSKNDQRVSYIDNNTISSTNSIYNYPRVCTKNWFHIYLDRFPLLIWSSPGRRKKEQYKRNSTWLTLRGYCHESLVLRRKQWWLPPRKTPIRAGNMDIFVEISSNHHPSMWKHWWNIGSPPTGWSAFEKIPSNRERSKKKIALYM